MLHQCELSILCVGSEGAQLRPDCKERRRAHHLAFYPSGVLHGTRARGLHKEKVTSPHVYPNCLLHSLKSRNQCGYVVTTQRYHVVLQMCTHVNSTTPGGLVFDNVRNNRQS